MESVDPKKDPLNQPPMKGLVNFKCTTIRNVLSSAMKSELWTPFCRLSERHINAHGNHIDGPRQTNHPRSDEQFINDNIHQQCSRATDIQGQFLLYWMAGENNMVDYFTKNHPTSHHQSQLITYIVSTVDASKYICYNSPNELLGFVEILHVWVNVWRTEKVSLLHGKERDNRRT